MSEHSITAPKTGFPWALAFKLGLQTAGYAGFICVFFGVSTLLIEKGYEQFGLPGLMLIFVAFGLLVAVSENATDIWAHVLPVVERKLAAFRDRLGL